MDFKNILLIALAAAFSLATTITNTLDGVETRGDAPCYKSAPGHICAVHGSLNHPNLLTHDIAERGNPSTKPATNELNCRVRCEQFVQCQSFAWHADTQLCQIYTKHLAEQDFVAGNSQEVYYDRQCFNCLNGCPRPLNQNLLVNGGFDQFPDSISPWKSLLKLTLPPGHGSKQAVSYTPARFSGSYLAQHIFPPLCPNDTYLISLDYKFTVQRIEAGKQLSFHLTDLGYQAHPNNKQDNKWVTVSALAHSSKYSDFTLNIGVSKHQEISVDNIKITRVKDPRAIPTAPNLLFNPGFESGTTDGYSIHPNCTLVSPGHKSSYAVACQAVPQRFDAQPPMPITQNVNGLVANSPHIVGFDYKIRANRLQLNSCSISVFLGPVHLDGVQIYGNNNLVNKTWAHYETSVLVPSNSENLTIVTSNHTPGGLCDTFIDNISIKMAAYPN